MNEKMNEKKSGGRANTATKLINRVIRYMLHYYKAPFIIVIACILITAIATVVGATFPQTLVDDYITPMLQNGSDDFSGLAADLIRLACVMGVGVITAFSYNRIMVNVSQGTMRHLRDDLFRRMESLPIKYFDTHAHGDIMSVYTNDVDTLRQLISQSIPQLINSSVTIVPSFLSMLALNVPLTLLTLAMVGVMALVTSKIAAKSAACFAKQQRDLGAVNGYISPSVQGITRLRLRPAPCRSSRSKAKAPVRTASEGAFSQDSASFIYFDGVSGKRQMSLCLLRRFPVQRFSAPLGKVSPTRRSACRKRPRSKRTKRPVSSSVKRSLLRNRSFVFYPLPFLKQTTAEENGPRLCEIRFAASWNVFGKAVKTFPD